MATIKKFYRAEFGRVDAPQGQTPVNRAEVVGDRLSGVVKIRLHDTSGRECLGNVRQTVFLERGAIEQLREVVNKM